MKEKFNKIINSTGYISVSPLPSAEELRKFYADAYYQQSLAATYRADYPQEELNHKRLRAELLLHALKSVRKANDGKSFLEVGCGEGFVLQAAHDAGYDVEGIDFSSYGVKSFHPHFESVLSTGDAFELLDVRIKSGTKVDVCVLQNVLEHVIDPEGLMDRIKRILTPDGLAVINIPNDFSRIQEKLKDIGSVDRDYWFLPPHHLHYFNVDTIGLFIESVGFEVVDTFGDFPIELFLFCPGSNYVTNADNGPSAHKARIEIDLLLAERGIDNYHRFCQSMSGCGIGRNVCVIVRVKD
ncbi:MAG: class I SAM-dependent methyltransferase [Rhodospirillaceae bacterium]|nr:class I SAM-dependent methyltransferase [Rhodospirillaceae bacterium]